MKKKSEFAGNHSMVLEIHCEQGDASLKVDISYLTRQERKFLFNLLRIPEQGGNVGFGVEPDEHGRKVMKFVLEEAPKIADAVHNAVAAH